LLWKINFCKSSSNCRRWVDGLRHRKDSLRKFSKSNSNISFYNDTRVVEKISKDWINNNWDNDALS